MWLTLRKQRLIIFGQQQKLRIIEIQVESVLTKIIPTLQRCCHREIQIVVRVGIVIQKKDLIPPDQKWVANSLVNGRQSVTSSGKSSSGLTRRAGQQVAKSVPRFVWRVWQDKKGSPRLPASGARPGVSGYPHCPQPASPLPPVG